MAQIIRLVCNLIIFYNNYFICLHGRVVAAPVGGIKAKYYFDGLNIIYLIDK